MLGIARVLYSMVSPTQARSIANNVRVGLEMGKTAELVMASPVESWFEESVASVRARLRIPDPREAGVLPSGGSVLMGILYPAARRGTHPSL